MQEIPHHAKDPHFNFIVRTIPERDIYPWFYVIASQGFDTDLQLQCMENIIKVWMQLAEEDILLEAHTQNILVDKSANIIYRDLSDARSATRQGMQPSYLKNGSVEPNDLLSIVFDRTVCNVNMTHLFKYNKNLNESHKEYFRDLIQSLIEKYNLPFPDYRMDFSMTEANRIPMKYPLSYWREKKK
jgi:siderophore synthetase component